MGYQLSTFDGLDHTRSGIVPGRFISAHLVTLKRVKSPDGSEPTRADAPRTDPALPPVTGQGQGGDQTEARQTRGKSGLV